MEGIRKLLPRCPGELLRSNAMSVVLTVRACHRRSRETRMRGLGCALPCARFLLLLSLAARDALADNGGDAPAKVLEELQRLRRIRRTEVELAKEMSGLQAMGAKKAMHSTTNQEHSAMEQLAVQEAVSCLATCAMQYHAPRMLSSHSSTCCCAYGKSESLWPYTS